MSNCVDICNDVSLRFTAKEIDLVAYKAVVDRVRLLPDAPRWEVDPDGYFVWWFLSNSQFVSPNGIPAAVTIHIGHGRSSHTWRDLAGTLLILGYYVKVSREITFILTDECDGHMKKFKAVWIMSPNGGRWEGQ